MNKSGNDGEENKVGLLKSAYNTAAVVLSKFSGLIYGSFHWSQRALSWTPSWDKHISLTVVHSQGLLVGQSSEAI